MEQVKSTYSKIIGSYGNSRGDNHHGKDINSIEL